MTRPIMIAAILTLLTLPNVAHAAGMTLKVDATDLPRKLLHAEMTFPVEPGPLVLWYPKWVPGVHAPGGPVQNVSGLYIETADGKRIPWERDAADRHRFHCDIPDGVGEIRIRLDYICSQSTTNSSGVDSYGSTLSGIINWNTCILYPEHVKNDAYNVDLSVTLPEDWDYATALDTAEQRGGEVRFQTATLQTVVDSPLIAGEYFRHIPLDARDINPITLHLVAESSGPLQISDELIAFYGKMGTEAGLLFGAAPYDEYELLLMQSGEHPYNGLEHLCSSLNVVGERDLLDDDSLQDWVGYLVPHEFVHSWCGKYRRPAGMDTRDYHMPKDTRHLWLYEGLTQYLGHVLTVRGGLWEVDHYKDLLSANLSYFKNQVGRQWRSLEDTAIDSHHLRAHSKHWSTLRRGQDYYNEGALFWMEADAIIRLETDGRKSLDDFCRAFMGPDQPDQPVVPFTEEEVLETLNDVLDYDWAGFVDERIKQPQERYPLDLVGRLGYRLQYATERSERQKKREQDRKYVSAHDSLGFSVNSSGEIGGSVVPGMPGEQAGLGPGMKIIGINDRTFSLDRFRDAIADSVTMGGIDLLVAEGDVLQTIHLDYADGPKYLELVRDQDRRDILAEIMKPRAEE